MEECYHDRHEKKPFEFPGVGGKQEKQGGKGNLREQREEE